MGVTLKQTSIYQACAEHRSLKTRIVQTMFIRMYRQLEMLSLKFYHELCVYIITQEAL